MNCFWPIFVFWFIRYTYLYFLFLVNNFDSKELQNYVSKKKNKAPPLSKAMKEAIKSSIATLVTVVTMVSTLVAKRTQ